MLPLARLAKPACGTVRLPRNFVTETLIHTELRREMCGKVHVYDHRAWLRKLAGVRAKFACGSS